MCRCQRTVHEGAGLLSAGLWKQAVGDTVAITAVSACWDKRAAHAGAGRLYLTS